MEFWLLILVLCHATKSIESVNSPQNNVKIYKTFDEIFGEGWDNEEKPKLSEPTSATENSHQNSHHNEQNESETSWDRNDRSEIDLNQVPVELVDLNPLNDLENEKACSKGHKKLKCYSDERKREIVQEYIALKNKLFAQEKKHSQNEWKQFSVNVTKDLGVSHGTVFKWKNQFGLSKKWPSHESNGPPFSFQNDQSQVAYSRSIKRYSDERKREIVQEFIELKNKFMQEKQHSYNEWKQFEANICKELGVGHTTIFKWKKQFFGVNKKSYTDEQKQEKLKEYYKIKLRNPKINDQDIAAALEITIRTLNRWKLQFQHLPELNVPKSNGPSPF